MHDFSPKLLACEFNTMIDAKFEDQAWRPLRARVSTLKRYTLKTHENVISGAAWEIDNGLDFQLHPDEKSHFMNLIPSARPTVSYRVFLYAVCSEGFSIDRESLRRTDTLNSQDFRMIALQYYYTRAFIRTYLVFSKLSSFASSTSNVHFYIYVLNYYWAYLNIAFGTTQW